MGYGAFHPCGSCLPETRLAGPSYTVGGSCWTPCSGCRCRHFETLRHSFCIFRPAPADFNRGRTDPVAIFKGCGSWAELYAGRVVDIYYKHPNSNCAHAAPTTISRRQNRPAKVIRIDWLILLCISVTPFVVDVVTIDQLKYISIHLVAI